VGKLVAPHPDPLPQGEREEYGGGTGCPSPQRSPTRGEGEVNAIAVEEHRGGLEAAVEGMPPKAFEYNPTP